MRTVTAVTTCLLCLSLQSATAQLVGTYTVGGDSPDFASIQEAADSLYAAGVGGPVDIFVRPGVYTSPDSAHRVLDLPSEIPGASVASAVRFGPEQGSGATSSNVVLRRFRGPSDNGFVVRLKASFTTVEGFTVEMSDTTAGVAQVPSLVYVDSVIVAGVRNLIVDGLGGRRAWRCILLRDIGEDVFVMNNRVSNCIEPIYQINYGPAFRPPHRLTISGNHMTGMSILPEARDPEYGLHLRLDAGAEDVVLADNVLDFRGASGISGIAVTGAGPKTRLRVERNQVLGLDSNYFPFTWGPLLQVDDAPDGLIANNFLSGNSSRGGGVVLNMGQWSDTLTLAASISIASRQAISCRRGGWSY